jgi:hypothetical protein
MATATAGRQTRASSTPAPPSFDIVRIGPQGGAIIAGRGAPGADLSIRADGVEVGRTTADGQGAWALVLAQPLPPGPHVLTLREHTAEGRELASIGAVLMTVPGQVPGAAGPLPPLAVLTTPQLPPRLLQSPPVPGSATLGPGTQGLTSQGLTTQAPAAPDGATLKPRQLGLGALDYDVEGDLRLSGTAPPDTTVRLYADNKPIGEVRSGKDGVWSAAPGAVVTEGNHQLRLDQIGSDGKVSARVALPFRRESVRAGDLTADRIVVQPGASLWRIAYRAYGEGLRYTVIFQANRDQIRNPDLIYPGQVFTLPAGVAADPDGRVMPVSSSKSR